MKICAEKGDADNWVVSVLSDKWIQRWSISSSCAESFLFEDFEIVRKVREAFHTALWPNQDILDVETHLLDMHAADGCLHVLAAATNLNHTPQMHYALFTLNVSELSFVISNVCPIKVARFRSGDANDDNLKLKFIFNRSVAYVYGEKTIYEVLLHGNFQSTSLH